MNERAETLAKALSQLREAHADFLSVEEHELARAEMKLLEAESAIKELFAAAYRSQPSGFLPPGTVIDYMWVRATVLEGPFAWDAIPVQVEGDGVEVWNWDCDGVPCTVVSLPTPPSNSQEQKT